MELIGVVLLALLGPSLTELLGSITYRNRARGKAEITRAKCGQRARDKMGEQRRGRTSG